jgi:hypothetical protein
MASINYLIQLIAVVPNLVAGETEGLGLWVGQGQFRSVFWAVVNAYTYMSLSMLFAAWAFGGSRLERWVRGLRLAAGVTAPLQFAFTLGLVPPAAALPAIPVWVAWVPLACTLLARWFARAANPDRALGSQPGRLTRSSES